MKRKSSRQKKDDPDERGPKFLIWIATTKCNLNCSHCYAAKFANGELSLEEKFSVVRDAAQTGIREINLIRGTGTWELFLSGVKRLRNFGVPFATVMSLNNQNYKEVSSYLSLAKDFGVPFATVMSLNNQNYKEVSSYLSLAKDLGANHGCLIPVMPTGRAKKEIILKPEQMIEVLRAAEEAAESLKFPTSLWCTPFARLIVKSRYVSAGYCRTWNNEIEIDPAGNVLLCDISDVKFSNILEKRLK